MITAEQLFASPQYRHYELVRGTLHVHEPPGGAHGRIAATMARHLGDYVERHALGTVLVESGYILRRAPDTVRGPDISFIAAARLAPNQIPDQFIPIGPDLAIEVLSPGDREDETRERVGDFFAHGTRALWVVDPRARCVVVWRAAGATVTLGAADELDGGDVVPGFRCRVADILG